MPEMPQILRTEIVARSRLFQIEQVDLRFANGVEAQYERLTGSGRGSVLVVPMPDADTLLLVREYAAGVHRYELGFPKGIIEPQELAEQAANRELMEEIGFGARQLQHLTALTIAPGYLAHTTHVVLARDLYECELSGDEPEAIEVVPWHLSRMSELLSRPDFTEARSLAALFLVKEMLNHGL